MAIDIRRMTLLPGLAAALSLLALLPVTAAAQGRFESWPTLTRSGIAIQVVDDTGAETKGRLLTIGPDSIVLLVDGAERRFEAERVSRLEKRGDSLRNGVLTGLAIGGGVGLLTAGISDCPGADRAHCPRARAVFALASIGIYTALGAAIDAMIPGRTTLYVAPRRAERSAAAVGGGAVGLSVRW